MDTVRKHTSRLQSRALSGCPLEQLIDDNKPFCLSRHQTIELSTNSIESDNQRRPVSPTRGHGVFDSGRMQDRAAIEHELSCGM